MFLQKGNVFHNNTASVFTLKTPGWYSGVRQAGMTYKQYFFILHVSFSDLFPHRLIISENLTTTTPYFHEVTHALILLNVLRRRLFLCTGNRTSRSSTRMDVLTAICVCPTVYECTLNTYFALLFMNAL